MPSPSRRPMTAITTSIAVLLGFCGCRQETPPPKERIRAIKTITVTERASGRIRKFSGVVEAADNSNISFEVSGNVQEVKVDRGDKVAKGQVLAVMDKRTFQLNVEAAEAALGRSKVQLADKRKDFDRFRRIAKMDPGAVSQASLDQSKAAYESAKKNVKYTTSQLNLAKRDLEKTVLRAPFEGIIAERFVDPFQEVARGEKCFAVYMEGAMEAAVSIPETEIEGVHLGLPAEIRFPIEAGKVFRGTVTEISSVAGKANAFPVKTTILTEDDRIRPGLTAEVTILLEDDSEETAYLVPIVAVAPGDEKGRGYVFKFDPGTSTVKKTSVQARGAHDNDAVITEGVKAGDIIAVAGVSFLEDGQKVKLMEQ